MPYILSQKKIRQLVPAALSAFFVLLLAGAVKVYGLYDRLYFSKSTLSLFAFLLGFYFLRRSLIFLGRALRHPEEKRRFLIAFFTCFCLFFTELFGALLRLHESGASVRLTLSALLLFLALAALLSLMLTPFFLRAFSASAVSSAVRPFGRFDKGLLWRLWLLIFVCFLPCFFAFYPGIYCYDMSWQWQMVLTGDYSTHHPILHTLLSGGLFEKIHQLTGSYNLGLAAYSLIQLLILSLSMAFALCMLKRWRTPKPLLFGTLLFFILFPFHPVLGVSTTKDVIFAALFLPAFCCLCDMVLMGRFYRTPQLIMVAFLLVLMQLFRNNAVYAVSFTAALLFFAALYLKRKAARRKNMIRSPKASAPVHKKRAPDPYLHSARYLTRFALLLLASAVLSQAGFFGLKAAFHARSGSVAEMLSIPCQQLARTYVEHGGTLSSEDREMLFSYVPEEYLQQYKYYVSDPVKNNLNEERLNEDLGGFLKLWFKIGLQHPSDYVTATLANTMGLWYLGGDSSCFMEYNIQEPLDETHGFTAESRLPLMKRYYSFFTDENLQAYFPLLSMIFYTSFYSWAVVLTGVAALLLRRYRILIPTLFLVSYMLTLVLGPCITVRYMYAIMLSLPVLAAAFLRARCAPQAPFMIFSLLPSVYFSRPGIRRKAHPCSFLR